MNKLRSVLKKRRAKEDPRVRRRLFSWRMFAIILLVVSVLSAGNGEHGRGFILGCDGVSGGNRAASVYLPPV